MQWIIDILTHIGPTVAAVNGVLAALIAFFLIIPGEQPEKALQAIVDFLSKFSVK